MKRSDRPDHRHRAGALRRVRADRLHQRPVGPVLQAVRADHRHLDHHLGFQLADPLAGAVGAAAEAARRRAGPGDARAESAVRLVLPAFQPLLRARLRPDTSAPWRGCCVRSGIALFIYGGLHPVDLVRLHRTSDRLRAAAGQAVPGRLCAAARCGDARSHRGSHPAHEHMALATPGVESPSHFPACRSTASPTPQRGHRVRAAEILRRAPGPGTFGRRHRRGANGKFAPIQDAYIAVFPPPPVQGLGTIGGFKHADRGSRRSGSDELYSRRRICSPRRGSARNWRDCSPAIQVNVPQIQVDVDREKLKAAGVACRTCSTPCRCTWELCTSTTSTASAVPTRSMPRRVRISPQRRGMGG